MEATTTTGTLTEQIAERAYHKFLARQKQCEENGDCPHGKDTDDWLEAEKEIMNGDDQDLSTTTGQVTTALRRTMAKTEASEE